MYFRYAPKILNDDRKLVGMVYINGSYKRLKPYIYIDPVAFYEANNLPVFVTSDNGYDQFYAYPNGLLASIDDLKYYDEGGNEITT